MTKNSEFAEGATRGPIRGTPVKSSEDCAVNLHPCQLRTDFMRRLPQQLSGIRAQPFDSVPK